MFIAHIADDGSIQTCQTHCRGAAERAAAALSSVRLEKTGYLAGLLHDAGKFTPEFSNYIRAAVDGHARKGSVIHTFAAVRYLLRAFHGTTNALTFEDIAAEILAVAVGAHHGCFDLYMAVSISMMKTAAAVSSTVWKNSPNTTAAPWPPSLKAVRLKAKSARCSSNPRVK